MFHLIVFLASIHALVNGPLDATAVASTLTEPAAIMLWIVLKIPATTLADCHEAANKLATIRVGEKPNQAAVHTTPV